MGASMDIVFSIDTVLIDIVQWKIFYYRNSSLETYTGVYVRRAKD